MLFIDIVRHSVNGKLFMFNSLISDLNSTSFAVKTNCRDGNAWVFTVWIFKLWENRVVGKIIIQLLPKEGYINYLKYCDLPGGLFNVKKKLLVNNSVLFYTLYKNGFIK